MAVSEVEMGSTLVFKAPAAMADSRFSRPQSQILQDVYKGLIFFNQGDGKVYAYTGDSTKVGAEINLKRLAYADEVRGGGAPSQAISFIGLLSSADVIAFTTSAEIPAGRLVTYDGTLYYSKVAHTGAWNDSHFQEVLKGNILKASQSMTVQAANNDSSNQSLSVLEGALLMVTAISGTSWKVVDFGVNLSNYLQLSATEPTAAQLQASNIKILFKDENDKVFETADSLENIILSYKGSTDVDSEVNPNTFAPTKHTHGFEGKTSEYITLDPETYFTNTFQKTKYFTKDVSEGEGAQDTITTGGIRKYMLSDSPIFALNINDCQKLEDLCNAGFTVIKVSKVPTGGECKSVPVSSSGMFNATSIDWEQLSKIYILVDENTCFPVILNKLQAIISIKGYQYLFKIRKLSQSLLTVSYTPLIFVDTGQSGIDVSYYEGVLSSISANNGVAAGTTFTAIHGSNKFVYTSDGNGGFYVEEFTYQ